MESTIESNEPIKSLESDFVNNIEGAVRRHGVIDIKDGGQSKDVIGGAFRVHFENIPEDAFPKGITGKLVEAAARVETVRQQCTRLEPKQKEFAIGLVDNLLGAYAFISELPEKMRDVLPTKGKWPILAVEAVLMLEWATACTKPASADYATPTRPVAAEFTKTPLTSPTVSYATETPFVPTITTTPIPTETLTPTEVVQETIDLPMTDGETFTMDKFETPQEALDYLAKNTRWYNSRTDFASWFNTIANEDSSFEVRLRKIDERILSEGGNYVVPESGKSYFYLDTVGCGNGTIVVFENKDNKPAAIYVDEKTSTFDEFSQSNSPATPTSGPTQ